MDLNEIERKVLAFLGDYVPEEQFSGFDRISREVGLDREAVRYACRSLRSKGLAIYANALWTEDGEMRGAGYGATKAGRDLAAMSNG